MMVAKPTVSDTGATTDSQTQAYETQISKKLGAILQDVGTELRLRSRG